MVHLIGIVLEGDGNDLVTVPLSHRNDVLRLPKIRRYVVKPSGVEPYSRMSAANLLAWLAAGHTRLPEPQSGGAPSGAR